MKKTGLGRDPLSWINPTSKEKKSVEKELALQMSPGKKRKKEHLPKFRTFEVRLTSLLREDQLEFLEKLIRDIRKNRIPGVQERTHNQKHTYPGIHRRIHEQEDRHLQYPGRRDPS